MGCWSLLKRKLVREMSGFSGPEKFTLLVSVDAPPWVDRNVRSVLCRMHGLTSEERANVFETRELAVAAGARVLVEVWNSDESVDVDWLFVVPLASFSFG